MLAKKGSFLACIFGEGDLPKRYAAVIFSNRGDQTGQEVGVDDVFHDGEVQIPFLLVGPVGAVGGVNEVHGDLVVFECMGETEC